MKPDNTAKEPAVAYHREIHSLNQLDMSKRYSYADYFQWKFKERVELIKGLIYKMSPAPSPTHQSVSFKTGLKFGNFFEGVPCAVFTAPFDVRLPDSQKQSRDEQIYTVVQPDLCVICDLGKIDKRGCLGPPDLVVEVLSPGNTQKEMGLKFRLYEENGVKEYWLIHPAQRTITVYSLQSGKYTGIRFSEKEEVCSVLFPKLKFRIGEIFDATLFEWYKNVVREPEPAYGSSLSLPADRAARQLTGMVQAFFENKPCKLLTASAGIRFPGSESEEASTVRHPDLAVICNPDQTDDRGTASIPDLIIEILTPESTPGDTGIRYKLYEASGVKEYWLVSPEDKVIFIHVLQDGKYVVQPPFTEDNEACSSLFPELKLGLSEVFR